MKFWIGWMLCIPLALLLTACGGRAASADPQQIELGKMVYETNCAACHGAQGEGEPNWKTPDADGVYPAPPHDAVGHTWHHPDAVLLQAMREGSGMPNSKMPIYAEVLSQTEMEAVLAYIKTFWGAEERDFQQQMTEQWKEQNR